MSRGFAAAGVGLAGLCGILIAYSTLKPELEKERAERTGEFQVQQSSNDRAISEAIMSDLKEAKKELQAEGGFGWGIRKAIWGGAQPHASNDRPTAAKTPNEDPKEPKLVQQKDG